MFRCGAGVLLGTLDGAEEGPTEVAAVSLLAADDLPDPPHAARTPRAAVTVTAATAPVSRARVGRGIAGGRANIALMLGVPGSARGKRRGSCRWCAANPGLLADRP